MVLSHKISAPYPILLETYERHIAIGMHQFLEHGFKDAIFSLLKV
jgi:hypothetical protein